MNPTYKTIIIDDLPSCIEDIKKILQKDNRFEVVATASNGLEGVDQIRLHNPDLVLTDIEMPVMNGFDMVVGLKEMLDLTPTIIFITVYDQYAIQAIRCSAFDFILKTSLEQDLPVALNEYVKKRTTKQPLLNKQIETLIKSFERNKQIIIRSNICDNFINPMEILYISTSKNHANSIFMKNGECIATNQSLTHFEEILSKTDFFRLNKSNIININFIKEIRKESNAFRRKYVYMQHTETDIKLAIPPGKYAKLFEFIEANSSPEILT